MANVEKLIKLRDTILEFKENFNYAGVYGTKEGSLCDIPMSSLLIHNSPNCGCVIGFWGALSSQATDSVYFALEAQDSLDLTDDERRFLFYGNPLGPFGNFNYSKAKLGEYQEAIDRINYLINLYSK